MKTLVIVLGLLCLVQHIQAVKLQLPFLSPKSSTPLKLKTIYHHASVHGPIPRLFRKLQIHDEMNINQEQNTEYSLKSKQSIIEKPADSDIKALLSLRDVDNGVYARWSSLNTMRAMYMESTLGKVPDVTDRETVISLAMMTNNAYLDINLNDTEWYDLGAPWQLNDSFGWESDGIRGHIFATEDNSLVVVSFKGTSAGLWTGGPTGEKDKLNDNMLFSCCCARISRAWTPVCKCFQGNEYRCESKCLQDSIQQSELYYDAALEIIEDIQNTYNQSTIWITGHSLGGALASLVGQTYGIPTVTFEAPGDQMAARRLHLPGRPAAKLPIWHFGHTADPIFIGACTGPASSCWYGGFAMESRCHTGKICSWDTVNKNGWRVDIRSHRVRDVIENILKKPEEFPLPECQYESEDCQDCGLWEYYDDRDGPFTSSTKLIPSTSTTDNNIPPTDPWASTSQ